MLSVFLEIKDSNSSTDLIPQAFYSNFSAAWLTYYFAFLKSNYWIRPKKKKKQPQLNRVRFRSQFVYL